MDGRRRSRFLVLDPARGPARTDARDALDWLGKRLAFEHWFDGLRRAAAEPRSSSDVRPASA
jgi:hypothetical protein